MKKLILAACLFATIYCPAQDQNSKNESAAAKLEMAMNAKIAMDIDQTIYTMNQGNTYINADQTAGIVAMVAPKSYAEMKSSLKDGKAGDMEITDRGETTLGGKNVLFMKGTKKQDDQDFTMWVYCKENDADSCIMVNGFYETKNEKEFKPRVDKAITSAKLVK